MGKYDPLRDYLVAAGPSAEMSFEEVGRIVGGLPRSAYTWEWWWANDDATHPQSRAWGDAGYETDADVSAAVVRFRRRR